MSFAECTATSMRPSSSASSSSFTNTPRVPISPNGFVRSRSPAVVIGTRAISMPGAPQPRCRLLGLREREPTAAGADPEQHRRRGRKVTKRVRVDAPSAPAAASFIFTVGPWSSLSTMREVTASTARRSVSVSRSSRVRARSSSLSRISSASARSEAIAGTTSRDACQARNRSASSSTISSARPASRRRPARLSATTLSRSSMS